METTPQENEHAWLVKSRGPCNDYSPLPPRSLPFPVHCLPAAAGVCDASGAGGLRGERHDDKVRPDSRPHRCVRGPPGVRVVAAAGRGRNQQTGESQSSTLLTPQTTTDHLPTRPTPTSTTCRLPNNLPIRGTKKVAKQKDTSALQNLCFTRP